MHARLNHSVAGVTDCTLTASGGEYVGYKSVTASGKQCQPWASQTPHSHGFVQDGMFPDGSLEDASNFCRNPENGFVGVWCYTTDPHTRWERCDVPTCGQSTHFVSECVNSLIG